MLKISKHWFDTKDVERRKTKKISRGTTTPKFLVIHYTAGHTTEGDLFTLVKSKRQASCQLVIGREGDKYQTAGLNRRAWHAGPSRSHGYKDLNTHSIGFELCNIGWLKKVGADMWRDPYGQYIDGDGNFRDKDRKMACSIPVRDWEMGRHKNNGSGEYSWEPFPDAQLDATEQMVEAILAKYPTVKYIVGHDEIDTRGWKTDPGPAFPMERFQKLIEDRGTGSSVSEPDDDEDDVATFQAHTEVNMRSAPGMHGDIIGVVPRWRIGNVYEMRGNWYLMQTTSGGEDDMKGWVYSKYLNKL